MTVGTAGGSEDRPAIFFADPTQWRAWLERHHDSESEVWMELRRAGVAERGITWDEAVLEALCFGWIDSTSQRIDHQRRRQRWSPRRRGSQWSEVNIAHVARLTSQGRMHPAGLVAFEQRRPDDHRSYSFENKTSWPDEFEAQVQQNPAASAFLASATPGYRKVAQHWVASAKREATRRERLRQYIDDSAHGRLITPQRYGVEPVWVARARDQIGTGPPSSGVEPPP